jgi:hypothetical protein
MNYAKNGDGKYTREMCGTRVQCAPGTLEEKVLEDNNQRRALNKKEKGK